MKKLRPSLISVRRLIPTTEAIASVLRKGNVKMNDADVTFLANELAKEYTPENKYRDWIIVAVTLAVAFYGVMIVIGF